MPKITIDLDLEKADRLKEYLNWVQEKDNSLNAELSDYWTAHTDKIDIKFDKNKVFLSGESGFYFPRKLNLTNQLSRIARLFPTRLSYGICKAYQKFSLI